jgi:hypothetical protein
MTEFHALASSRGLACATLAGLGLEGFPHAAFGLALLSFYLEGFVPPAAAHWMYVGAVAEDMKEISYAGYRFPPGVIHQAILLYLRFTLSFRDVEDLLAERGIAVVSRHLGARNRMQ